jgi:hypothetical protein
MGISLPLPSRKLNEIAADETLPKLEVLVLKLKKNGKLRNRFNLL